MADRVEEELTCKELVELITDYLDGKLEAHALQRFELHLGHCRRCKAYFRQMQQTIQLVGKLSEETIPPQARDELLQVFQDWKKSGNTPA